jgi:lysine 6-dehydrogenase
MKILILGSGLIGPAAAFNAMADPEVSKVVVCDSSEAQLDACRRKLDGRQGSEKFSAVQLDLADRAAAVQLLSGFDIALAALPHSVNIHGIRAALQARKPLVDLTWPDEDQVATVKRDAETTGTLIVPGCGLEPGLTEIMARHLAEKMDHVDEVHIKCGGIPAMPAPPLGYKIVFGGRQLPLRESDAWCVSGGELRHVPRYSGVESLTFEGVDEVEAWHEGFMPWLLELPALKSLRTGTQKTIRWPGYAAKVTLLKELGLLSLTPVNVEDAAVTPKKFLDALLYPRVKLEEGEHDITLFRVEVTGRANGLPRRYRIDMVDRYDEKFGFTSMARTTAFTGAIVARMIARGDIKGSGLISPEKLIAGAPFDRLVNELAEQDVHFELTTQEIRPLGPVAA